MDLLDRFEALLKNIVDGGILSRLARTVQPAEIARRLSNEMEFNYGKGLVGPGGRISPNDFTVHLNPEDYGAYEQNHESVEAYVARYLDDFAAREGLLLLGPAAVHLTPDERQARHTLRIESTVRGGAPPTVTFQRPPDEPAQRPSVVSPRAGATLVSQLVDLGSGARIPLGERQVTLGRALENSVVANNEYVSRAHAEILPRNGRFYLRDLSSRNGTFLNGKRVNGERALSPNDTISLGPEPVGKRYRFEQAGGQ